MDLRELFLGRCGIGCTIEQLIVGPSDRAVPLHSILDEMNLFLYHYLFIIAVLFGTNLMALESKEVVSSTTPKQYSLNETVNKCSHRLSQMISDFCNNKYIIVKRDTSLIIDKLIPEDLHKHIKRARLKRWRRVRRQVADECCNRPCTVSNILRYCPSDAVIVQEHPDMFTDLAETLDG